MCNFQSYFNIYVICSPQCPTGDCGSSLFMQWTTVLPLLPTNQPNQSYFRHWYFEYYLQKCPSMECHGTPLMIHQHWFGQWLGAARQQAITWTNADQFLWHLMATPQESSQQAIVETNTEFTSLQTMKETFNSLAPGKFKWSFTYVTLKLIAVIEDWGISCEIGLRRM